MENHAFGGEECDGGKHDDDGDAATDHGAVRDRVDPNAPMNRVGDETNEKRRHGDDGARIDDEMLENLSVEMMLFSRAICVSETRLETSLKGDGGRGA